MGKSTRKSKKSLSSLVKLADKEFSRYVRLRDSVYEDGVWAGVCISCDRKLVVVNWGHWNPAANLGHYIGRSCKTLRWNEENCNLQCAHCNAWRDKVSMIGAYKKALDLKYGQGTSRRLKRESARLHKPTRDELETIINDSREWVNYTLSHPV